MNSAVFPNRNGTLNKEAGLIKHVARIPIILRVAAAVRLIKRTATEPIEGF